MATVPDIIMDLGGPKSFGLICGFVENPAARGSDMKRRGSIPVAYWPRVVEAAKAKGKAVTFETLARLHSSSPARQPEPRPALEAQGVGT